MAVLPPVSMASKDGVIPDLDEGGHSLISRDEIIWLYRCLFGREVESERAIEIGQSSFSSFAEARATYMSSQEFSLAGVRNTGSVVYRPGRTRPFFKVADLIGLACIVKNESTRVADMLTSALPLIDFVSLVDTGSNDNTMEIAKGTLEASGVEHNVCRIPFENFSQARNASLNAIPARIRWVLVLDADEHIVSEDYQRFVDLTDVESVSAWNIPRFNFVDAAKERAAISYPDRQPRFFRSTPTIRFAGAVHEVLTTGGWGAAPTNDPGGAPGGPHIHHMGQVGLTAERWLEKHRLYESLALAST